jgi:hypothetical protein
VGADGARGGTMAPVQMSDVFLSYASRDRDTARLLARALTERGWSVFWDRTIPPGLEFDVVIAQELRAARCVVVLWSATSVSSRWVKDEADEAAARDVLVPALIEDIPLPLGFRRVQAARLVGWPDGASATTEFEQLVSSIARHLAGPPPGARRSADSPQAVPPPARTALHQPAAPAASRRWGRARSRHAGFRRARPGRGRLEPDLQQ